MRTQIPLQPLSGGRLVGARVKAIPVRERIESALSSGQEVVLDFQGVEATQSFIDELVGVLILSRGPDVLNKLVFRSCSETMQSIVRFVASDRADQFARTH